MPQFDLSKIALAPMGAGSAATGAPVVDNENFVLREAHTFSDHVNKMLCRFMPKLAAECVEYGVLIGVGLLVADLVYSKVIKGKNYLSY